MKTFCCKNFFNKVPQFLYTPQLLVLILKNHILKKAKKNKPSTRWELKFNKLVGKVRFKVERTFWGIKRWFNGGVARYRGIAKMHIQI